MGNKLFVGGLSYDTNEDALREEFSKAGNVESAIIVFDKMSGRSKGFGFVEMASENEAKQAIEMFNDKDVFGRKITVNEARPMGDRPPRRDFGGGNRGGFNRDRR